MANAETKDSSHGPATVDEQIFEFAPDDSFQCEEQPPRSGFIALISLTCLAFVLVVMGGLHAYWTWYYDSTMEQQNLGRESQQLLNLRKSEEAQMKNIDRAMQSVIQDAAAGVYGKNYQPAPVVAPAAAAPAAATGAQPAPAVPAKK
jgi:hypothetical protein